MNTVKEERLLEIFEDLVKIYSPTRRESQLAQYILAFLEKLGAEIYLDESQDQYGGDTPTILAKVAGQVAGPGVTFSAHMDVVDPNQGVQIIREGDILKTDGTTTLGGDDKAGIAAILYTLEHLFDQKIDHRDIYCIFTPGEEEGMLGARNIDWDKVYEHMNPAKNMIVLDNAGKSIYVAHQAPTGTNYRLTVTGKKAHAGISPESGVNAITILGEIVSSLPTGRIDQLTTANISQIAADFPTNIVPDQATAYGELRGHSEEKIAAILAGYEEQGREIAERQGGHFSMATEKMYPSLRSLDNLKFAREFIEVYKKIGVEAELQVIGGGSDANFFAEQGFNAIIIGVGMQAVHTTDEYLEIPELLKSTQALIEYLKEA